MVPKSLSDSGSWLPSPGYSYQHITLSDKLVRSHLCCGIPLYRCKPTAHGTFCRINLTRIKSAQDDPAPRSERHYLAAKGEVVRGGG